MDHYFPVQYFVAFFWGLAVLFGLVGLGRLAALLVGGEEAPKAGWGLHAVWGMAVYLLLGGVVAVFHSFTDLTITTIIGLGLASFVWTAARAGWPSREQLAALPWPVWPSFVLAAVSFGASVCWPFNVHPGDDLGAYFALCEKLLVTGSFDEPFSWHRLAELGGQTLLQGSILTNTSFNNIQMFEIGLAPVILLGLIVGFRQGALVRTPLGTFLAFVAVTTPILRINTASQYTSVIVFLGLFVTLDFLERVHPRRRWLVMAGLVAAAFCTLRNANIAAAVFALVLYWIGWWWRDRPAIRRQAIAGLWCGGALLVALLPWMLMSCRSNGSLLFPWFPGDHNPAFNPLHAGGNFYWRFRPVIQIFGEVWLIPLFLCLLVLPPWKKALAASSVAVAAVLASVSIAWSFSLLPDNEAMIRHLQPLLLVGALAALLTGAGVTRLRLAVWILTALGLMSTLDRRGAEVLNRYEAFGSADKSFLPNISKAVLQYRDAQMLIPEGKRVLVAADFPFLFDHARNEIWNADLPHAAGPASGWPNGQPPEATKQYLRAQGIEYYIHVDFQQSIGGLNREAWGKKAAGGSPLAKTQAPFYADFFETIDRLDASETVLGRSGALTVVQLKP